MGCFFDSDDDGLYDVVYCDRANRLVVAKAISEDQPELGMDTIAIIMDGYNIIDIYSYPRPKVAHFESPMLRWQNVDIFSSIAGPLASIDAVLNGRKPMAFASFHSESEYQIALDKVKASGLPFNTQPDQRTLNVTQPMTFGEAFDIESWLRSYAVTIGDDEDRPMKTHELLSDEDKAYLRSLHDHPMSHWLEVDRAPPKSNRRDMALMDLLLGRPVECTISTMLKL